jgi:hypothetical protein
VIPEVLFVKGRFQTDQRGTASTKAGAPFRRRAEDRALIGR